MLNRSVKISSACVAFIALVEIIFSAPLAQSQFVEKQVGYAFETPGFLGIPGPLAYDKERHRLAVSDAGRNLIYIFDLVERTYQTLGSDIELKEPQGMAFDETGLLYVTQQNSSFLLKFSQVGVLPETLNLKMADIHPGKITIGSGGELLLCDKDNSSVYLINTTDSSITKFSKKLRQPNGVLMQQSDEIFVADKGIDPVLVFGEDGEYIRRLSRPESPTSQVSFAASGLAIDQKGWLYTLDITHFKLISYDPTGVNRIEWAPPTPPFFPVDIAIDRYDAIYISDSGSGRVRIFVRGN